MATATKTTKTTGTRKRAAATRKRAAAAASKKPTKTDAQAGAWAALGYMAGKHGNREAVAVGKTPVALTVRGKVGGKPIEPIKLNGDLALAADAEGQTSTAPPADHLIALVLGHVAKSKQAGALKAIAEHFGKTGKLPACEAELKGEAAAMLKTLRIQKRRTKKGALTFQPQAG